MAFDDRDIQLKRQQTELRIQQTEYGIVQFFKTMPIWWRWLSASAIILIIPGFFIVKYSTSAIYGHVLAKAKVLVHAAQVVSLPVKVEQTGSVLISGTNYAAYAQVKNQNASQASPSLQYTFTFLAANGSTLNTVSGTDDILPGEEKYIVVPRVTLASAPASIMVTISPGTWQNRTTIPNVTLLSNTPTSADVQTGGYAVQGTVLNQSLFTLSTVTVNGFAYDAHGNVIAIMQTVANTLSPSENRAYRLFWPVAIANSVASVKVFPETDLLDSNNIQ